MEEKEYFIPLFVRISIILFIVFIFLVVVLIDERHAQLEKERKERILSAAGSQTAKQDTPPLVDHSRETLVLRAVINLDEQNFTTKKYIYTGWDLRQGAGEGHGRLGQLDGNIHRSAPFSVRLDPSSNADFGIENEGLDRSIWPLERIPVKAGDRINLKGYAMIERNDGDVSKFWVSPEGAHNMMSGPHDCPGGITDYGCPFVNRGGARAGIDFRNSQDVVFDFDMRIVDWSMEPYVWHHFEMNYTAPAGSVSVMPWLQGFEATAPASVWFDDVELNVFAKVE